jgi:hypothetical protein
MASSHVVGRTLPGLILDYLRQVGDERSNDAIRRGVGHDSRDCINTTLCRMHRLGWIERTRMGHYKIIYGNDGPPLIDPDQLMVSTMLDHLKAKYPKALREELYRRGWSQ